MATWNELKKAMDGKLTEKQKDIEIVRLNLQLDITEDEINSTVDIGLWC